MIQVVLAFPDGQRSEVLLAGVPRIGEHVRLRNGPGSAPSYVVEHVLWTEGAPEPAVQITVRPWVVGPSG